MERYSYVKDSSGNISAILIDINVWNQYLTFHAEAMYFIVGDTFGNPGSLSFNFNPEPKPGIVPKDFPNDISEAKN